LLVASISLVLWHGHGDTYRTAVGERRVVTLADGSRISLDASTTVEVAYNGERRALRLLAGRAKFDVAKDPRRPFTVSAGGKMVVATGTAFSVELVQSQMQVILYEGAVAVLENSPGDQPPRHLELAAARGAADNVLKPGRILIAPLDGPSVTVAPVDPVRSLSWEAGQVTFSDEPLSIAAERMNRYSRGKVTIEDEATGRLPVSGAFNAGDTEGFIDGVSTLYRLRKTRSGDSVALGGGS
jgi:transmembrane sensor